MEMESNLSRCSRVIMWMGLSELYLWSVWCAYVCGAGHFVNGVTAQSVLNLITIAATRGRD